MVFTGGGRTELVLDLLFDVDFVEAQLRPADVRVLTRPLWMLAENSTTEHGWLRPPLVRLVWGKTWNVPGVIIAVAERFDAFTGTGSPRRSWLRLSWFAPPRPPIRRRPASPRSWRRRAPDRRAGQRGDRRRRRRGRAGSFRRALRPAGQRRARVAAALAPAGRAQPDHRSARRTGRHHTGRPTTGRHRRIGPSRSAGRDGPGGGRRGGSRSVGRARRSPARRGRGDGPDQPRGTP
ncbi:hypothetical protein NKG94_10825 [Micromonospora sp. M12]